jgi:threonine dehydrogenase-like Zn-dependent dehydrogenase
MGRGILSAEGGESSRASGTTLLPRKVDWPRTGRYPTNDNGSTAQRDCFGGAGVVIGVTSYATEAVTQAIDLARRGGRVVLAGTKGPKPALDFYSDRVVLKEFAIFGALGVDSPSYERAIRLIESGKYPLTKMHTHTLPLEEAEHVLRLLAGDEPNEQAIHIALIPSCSS